MSITPKIMNSCLEKTTTISNKRVSFEEGTKMASLDKCCLKKKVASRTTATKVVRFDLDKTHVIEAPSLAEYNFVELYRIYYKPKDYERFLREADLEDTSSGFPAKLRLSGSPIPKRKEVGQRRMKMAHKIGSAKLSLQSIIISAALA